MNQSLCGRERRLHSSLSTYWFKIVRVSAFQILNSYKQKKTLTFCECSYIVLLLFDIVHAAPLRKFYGKCVRPKLQSLHIWVSHSKLRREEKTALLPRLRCDFCVTFRAL